MPADTVTIKPDMRVIHPEYGDITEDVARELAAIRQEDHRNLVRDAERLQAALVAEMPGEAIVNKSFALKARIHPAIYAHWRMKHGAGFWKHDMEWFLKKNPQCRVRSRPANAKVMLLGAEIPPAAPIVAPAPRRGPVGKRGRWAS